MGLSGENISSWIEDLRKIKEDISNGEITTLEKVGGKIDDLSVKMLADCLHVLSETNEKNGDEASESKPEVAKKPKRQKAKNLK